MLAFLLGALFVSLISSCFVLIVAILVELLAEELE